jgi:hypothetical protein
MRKGKSVISVFNKFLFFPFIALLFFAGFSCAKGTQAPKVPLSSYLIDGPWQLISATAMNLNGTNNTYIGLPGDSLSFPWSYDNNGNVSATHFNSYIGGVFNQFIYTILSEGTSNIYDTLICSPNWKTGFSDTLLITSFSDHLLVFQVAYSTPNGTGKEIDSLKKIRFY